MLYLEIWPSVVITESPLRNAFDDYVRVILYLLRQGEENSEWPAVADRYELATVLHGSVNQIVITALLYRRPRNLSAGVLSVVDLTLRLLGPAAGADKRRRVGAMP